MARSPAERQKIKECTEQLLEMTVAFCEDYLNDEFKELAAKLIRKMARKRDVPFLRGRIEIWAAAAIYALAQINWVFDQSSEPYVAASDISDYFCTSKSTVGQRAKKIRDMFNMTYYDKEFATEELQQRDPRRQMVMIDGFIVPISMLREEVREELRRQGII